MKCIWMSNKNVDFLGGKMFIVECTQTDEQYVLLEDTHVLKAEDLGIGNECKFTYQNQYFKGCVIKKG